MIKIEKIHIQKFRGIIDLEVAFKGQNFTICGPNGTGKSGIVDAIEFVLSGDISRLSGTGRGGVSVKTHAPHVDYRDNPEVAMVSLQGTVVSTGETFEISRNVANANTPTISPISPIRPPMGIGLPSKAAPPDDPPLVSASWGKYMDLALSRL